MKEVGITLIGEAAKDYIQYKYVELSIETAFLVILITFIILAAWKMFKPEE